MKEICKLLSFWVETCQSCSGSPQRHWHNTHLSHLFVVMVPEVQGVFRRSVFLWVEAVCWIYKQRQPSNRVNDGLKGQLIVAESVKCWVMKLTVNTAAEDLRSEADGAVGVPSLRVDADETSHCGNRKEPQHWDLWILVPFKDLCNSMRNS